MSLRRGTLTIAATGPGTAVIAVRPVGLYYKIISDRSTPVAGAGCISVSPSASQCAGYTLRVRYLGGSGGDIVDLSSIAVPDVVEGRGGNDAIIAGSGPNVVDGGAGDDALYGGASTDRLNGQQGDDILLGAAGDNTEVGGPGNDILDARQGNRNIVAPGSGDNTLVSETAPATAPPPRPPRALPPPANAEPVVKGDATSIAVRFHVKHPTPGVKVRICVHAERKSGARLPSFTAAVFPNHINRVKAPRRDRPAWYASASGGRC